MNAIFLFSNHNGIENILNETPTNKIFNINSKYEFDSNSFYLFKDLIFAPYTGEQIKSDSIIVVNDEISWECFNRILANILNVNKIFIVHRKPDETFIKKLNEIGLVKKCGIGHEPHALSDFNFIYKELYNITLKNKFDSKETVSFLINKFFQQGAETKGMNRKLELLLLSMTPEGANKILSIGILNKLTDDLNVKQKIIEIANKTGWKEIDKVNLQDIWLDTIIYPYLFSKLHAFKNTNPNLVKEELIQFLNDCFRLVEKDIGEEMANNMNWLKKENTIDLEQFAIKMAPLLYKIQTKQEKQGG